MSPMYSDMEVTSMSPYNNTTQATGDKTPEYVGYICAVAAVFLYGSNFVPVKKYHTGDGMFFQWILCSGVFFSGLVLQMIHNCTLYVLPMVGGIIWAIGNLCVVPVIKTIGLGLGMSIWGTTALCCGWAIGRFGLFGTAAASIDHHIINDFSVVLAVISIIILLFVKNEVSAANMEFDISDEKAPLLAKDTSINGQTANTSTQEIPVAVNQPQASREDVLVFKSDGATRRGRQAEVMDGSGDEDETMWVDNFSPVGKRIIGSVLSILSGIMYGVNFTPTLYVQNNYKSEKDSSGLDFVFAQFCGIYLASTFFFVVYCALKKNKPKVYPQVIVPGIISGIMWAVATGCWDIANSVLSQAISFPIVATGPSGLASLFWGTLIFREIKGCKNIGILVVGFLVNLTGSLLAAFSK